MKVNAVVFVASLFGSFPEIDSIAVKEYEGGKP